MNEFEWLCLAATRIQELDRVLSELDASDLARAIASKIDWHGMSPEVAVESTFLKEGRDLGDKSRAAA